MRKNIWMVLVVMILALGMGIQSNAQETMDSTQDEMADENGSQNDQESDEMSFSAKVRASLTAAGYIYEFYEDMNAISVYYTGNNCNELLMYIVFYEDENGEVETKFFSASLGNFDEDSFMNGLKICNELNLKYKWANFVISEDYCMICNYDAKYSSELKSDAAECIQMALDILAIIDDAYPEVMRARWGQ